MTRVLFEKKDTYSLRGIMMLWILLSHINQMWAQEFHFELTTLMTTLMGSGGYLGTSGFFLLSGYGVFLLTFVGVYLYVMIEERLSCGYCKK